MYVYMYEYMYNVSTRSYNVIYLYMIKDVVLNKYLKPKSLKLNEGPCHNSEI